MKAFKLFLLLLSLALFTGCASNAASTNLTGDEIGVVYRSPS